MTGLFCVFEWVADPTDGIHWRLVGTVRRENDWTSDWHRPLLNITCEPVVKEHEAPPVAGRLTLLWTNHKYETDPNCDVKLWSFKPPDEHPKWLTPATLFHLCHRYSQWQFAVWWLNFTDGLVLLKWVQRLAETESAKATV